MIPRFLGHDYLRLGGLQSSARNHHYSRWLLTLKNSGGFSIELGDDQKNVRSTSLKNFGDIVFEAVKLVQEQHPHPV